VEKFIQFSANLFRKTNTKFYQNRMSFIEDTIKTFWSLFCWTHCTSKSVDGILKSTSAGKQVQTIQGEKNR